MRPLRLELEAFGSYPGREVVDFEVLARRGLFAVTGPTGTGKTTVFDAMVFALYGQLPGERSSDGEARSHHAPPEVETSVTFEFAIDGERYRIWRSPTQQRPKRRGRGTTLQPARAQLSRVLDHGTEPLESRPTACTARCVDLVGLDCRQFQRVVLLPQGRFTEFLIATDEDRERLLRQLFGGQIYEDAVSWLRARVRSLEVEVAGVETEIAHRRRNAHQAIVTAGAIVHDHPAVADPAHDADPVDLVDPDLADPELVDPDRLVALLDELRLEMQARSSQLSEVREASARAAAAVERARDASRRFDDASIIRERLAELDRRDTWLERDVERVDASRRAALVVAAGETLDRCSVAAADARHALDEIHARVVDGFAALDRSVPPLEPVAVATAVHEVRRELDRSRELLADAASGRAQLAQLERDLEVTSEQHREFAAEIERLDLRIDELERTGRDLTCTATAVDRLAHDAGVAHERLEAHGSLARAVESLTAAEVVEVEARKEYEATMAGFVSSQAPRLAATLVSGQPCVVCGSSRHPAPATGTGGPAIDHEAVDAARLSWSRAERDVERCRIEADGFRLVLGAHVHTPEPELRSAFERISHQLNQARDAVTELEALEGRLASERSGRDRMAAATHEHLGEVQRLRGAVEVARADVERRDVLVADIDPALVAGQLELVDAIEAALGDLDGGAAAVASTAASLADARQVLESALAVSGYSDRCGAVDAWLGHDLERQLDQQIRAHRDEHSRLSTQLAQLLEQGVPDQRPDLDTLASEAERISTVAAESLRRHTTATDAIGRAEQELAEAAAVAEGSAELRGRCHTARVVFRTCNGEAGLRVKLERWVLAGELDRVTSAANAHLAVMTANRYALRRSVDQQRGGLTLEVIDAHTGTARGTATLSGGEQFQASLALALGLADVVSHGGAGSGKTFEALFVDEGFGSLDAEALDDAIAALSQLQSGGRMVGAITHVEAMKERLHPGIVVRPLGHGEGSTLTVNP